MKYISYLALLGAATLQSAAAQDAAKGPVCTAHTTEHSGTQAAAMALILKIMSGEIKVPKPTDDDETKNDFVKEYFYDTTKDECEEGLSCV